MQYEDFKMVFVDIDYLRTLYNADHEVMFREDYAYKKPFLGILITNESQKYVIPLTSAKLKHKSFSDSNKGYYRIYEIIDTRKTSNDKGVLVNVTDNSYFKEKNISKEESVYYKKKILSVLEIRKMIPVVDGVYSIVDLSTSDPLLSREEISWRYLTYKEFRFCKNIKESILTKADKMYKKQMETGKILRFHCNFKVLEEVAKSYSK